ncbi:heme exporter protein D [Bradyrhizobium sp. S3.12.5]|uniref:heme exporter protein CcmD n=1 Tax=Bradyrhizobium sp. S3.12.5 TaxID=3156386 RepID=UPI003396474E
MSLGTYALFIVASYALVTTVVALLIIWIVVDYRRQRARLKVIEASGLTRRSRRSARDVR